VITEIELASRFITTPLVAITGTKTARRPPRALTGEIFAAWVSGPSWGGTSAIPSLTA